MHHELSMARRRVGLRMPIQCLQVVGLGDGGAH
eukprot:COSAG06_NODE_44560_length_362_cov_0.969582_2_plen_32_part_01